MSPFETAALLLSLQVALVTLLIATPLAGDRDKPEIAHRCTDALCVAFHHRYTQSALTRVIGGSQPDDAGTDHHQVVMG